MPDSFFVDVILPIRIPNLYTYSVPDELIEEVAVGKRVIVQFGAKKKMYSALVRQIHSNKPEGYETKEIISVLDNQPIVTAQQFQFWDWMAEYYLCTRGEVMNAALPAALKLESETLFIFNKEINIDQAELSNDAYFIAEALEKANEFTIEQIQKFLHKKSVHKTVQELLEKKVVSLKEEIEDEYKPKYETYIRLHESFQDEVRQREIFDQLEKRAPKQVNALLAYLKISQRQSEHSSSPLPLGESFVTFGEVSAAMLMKESAVDASVIKKLIEKNIFVEEKKEVSRLDNNSSNSKTLKEKTESSDKVEPLNETQKEILLSIKKDFEEREVVLLHGVTSSGKTHIYIHLIEEQIKQGKQVLYLLPEIALTAQIISRLKKVFGNKVGVYHSRFSNNERVEIWKNTWNGNYQIVLGARSAIFLPFQNLGLILVDEEHDSSFKQYEPAPRYHARDAAVVLGKIHDAKCLLGTATPSIESYQNTKSGKYGLAVIKERFGGVMMPEILLVNMRDFIRQKKMHSHFTEYLLNEIKEALQSKEQVILFQNRRGFAPIMMCSDCGWIPKCKNCDVSLTYHKAFDAMRCHYCGYKTKVPVACHACGSTALRLQGFGTEKIEEDLKLLIPEARIDRLDLDAVKRKNGHQKVIQLFEEQKIDVLVGTQMVTKGLDFDHVRLVGILNADLLLHYPDLRSSERAFQLMAQVAGRAGRKQKQGKVIIQTSKPDHPVLQFVLHNNYEAFFEEEIKMRKLFKYPPFYRLINIEIKHRDVKVAEAAAKVFFEKIRVAKTESAKGLQIIGPVSPVISRIRNLWIKEIMIKMPKNSVIINEIKKLVRDSADALIREKKFAAVQVVIDVDPY